MYKLRILVLVVVAFACNKDDDPKVFDSLSGYWIVRTPDNETTLTFKIATDADGQYAIETPGVTHTGAGSVHSTQPIDARIVVISDTEIESITLRTDIFIIRLLGMTVNSNFTELQITNSIFTIERGFREFAGMQATRE